MQTAPTRISPLTAISGCLLHVAVALFSRTATPCPARRATSVAGTPEFSHSDTAACRRSYGRRPRGDLYWEGVSASLRAWSQTSL
jgi:hypothetical protein